MLPVPTPENTGLTLREYVDFRFQAEKERQETAKGVVDAHLAELNNAYKRADDVLGTYLPREIFDQASTDGIRTFVGFRESLANCIKRDELDGKLSTTKAVLDAQDTRIQKNENLIAGYQGRFIGVGAAFAIAVTLVNIGLRFVK